MTPRRIECNQTLGTPYDDVHLTVTVDGEQLPANTPVSFTRMSDAITGDASGRFLTGILLSGVPQYDVEVFADGVLVATVDPRCDETERIYARLAEVEAAEEVRVSEHLATMRESTESL
jgi:hypothetical protein